MGYPKPVYIEAFNRVKANREKNLSLAEQNKNRIYKAVPQLCELDAQIGMTTLKITRNVVGTGACLPVDALKEENLRLQEERNRLLENAGFSPNDLWVKFDCAKCEDTGYDNGHVCGCVKNTAREILYTELNRDVPLQSSKFENFELLKYSDTDCIDGIVPRQRAEKVLKYCKEYAEKFNEQSNNILFFGSTGLGKTHLSLAIANQVINKGFNVIYGPISRLLGKVEAEHFSSGTNNETLSALLSCDLLILDDLGTEFTSSFLTSAIYDIINSRLLSKKPIIINTNLTIEEIERKYSQRIVSRIAGNYKMLEIIGSDNRIS